jgi:hypothetical protein
MKRILLLVFLLVFSANLPIRAQVSAYTFAQLSGTYTELTSGTVLGTTSGNTFGTPSLDAEIYNLNALPFTFNYNGIDYNQIYVSSNGFITFGSTAPLGTNNSPLSNTAAYQGAVAAWGGDLNGVFNISGKSSTISWTVEGSAPNREIVVQWKDFRPTYSTSITSVAVLDFQIRLKETTNTIQVVYGPSSHLVGATNISTTRQVGLRGPSNLFPTNINNRTNGTTLSINSSTPGTLNTSTQAFSSINATPGRHTNGKIYEWTPPACNTPALLTSTIQSTSAATISWNALASASGGYDYIVSTVNTAPTAGSTPTGSTTSSSVALTGLTPNTTYYFWVRSNCGSGVLSNWSATGTFFTNYCVPTSSCTLGDVIASVTLNTLSNTTGTACSTAPAGYSDFTGNPALTTTLVPSTTYTVTVGAAAYAQSVAVWIDYNDDLVFDNVTERVGNTAAGSPVPVNGTSSFTITLGCTPPAGVHRMRIRSSDNSIVNGPAQTPCATYSYGETEDYLITIAAPPACPSLGAPITTVSTTAFTADLSFPLGCSTASNFDIEYGPVGFVQGTGTVVQAVPGTISGSTATVTLTGLNATTTYNVYIRANCGSGLTSSWVGAATATTLDPPCTGSPNFPDASSTTSASVCPNGVVSMTATGLSTGLSGLSNQWQFSTVSGGPYTNVVGGTGATSASYTTPALVSPGTYYYVLTSTCSFSSTSISSGEIAVTVNPLPTINVTPSNGGNFCGTGTLTATGAANYTWEPALFLESNTGATVISLATTNATFTVTGTDANGCVNTATSSINYTTPPALSATASTAFFCGTGGTSTLTASSAAAYDYVWQALDGAVLSTTTGSTTDATVTQTSAVKVTGTETATGCSNIQYYSIGVYPLPAATVTTTADGVCPGTSATINSGLSAGNFSSQSIPHAPLTPPASATTLVTGGVATPALSTGSLDDGGWNNIPVGFNFNFFGTSYNAITVGTNGTLFFGGGNVADFTFTTLPSAAEPFNMVAVLAMDNNLGGATGGTIKYWTDGYAPNRRFIVNYSNVQEYGDAKFSTSQAVFYETTGIVEVHVTSSTNIDQNKLVGINNGNGTVGVLAYASGTTASATNPIVNPFAFRFTPPSSYTTVWTATDLNGTTTIANGTDIFSQTVAPTLTTTYSISYTNQTTGCTNAAGSAQVTMQVLGTVAPSNVTAQASAGNACSGVSFNLSTNYTGLIDGLTYQWQVSTDNGTSWTDISGATALTYSTSITVPSLFRIGISSCGGTIEYSAPVSVGLSPPTDCYCTPVYTTGTAFGDLISNVAIVGTSLSNNTGFVAGGPSYTFYTGQPNYTATLLPSSSYTLQVSTGEYGDQGYAAWIDYNDDGLFDASELVGATPTVIGSGLTTGVVNASSSFTIALACTPPAGVHRMRIRGVYNQNGPTIDPCATYTWGETEDYLITIAPAPTCPAPGAMTAGTTTSTTAPLSWNMGCSVATNFDFEYGPVGFVQGTGTTISNQAVTVTGTAGDYTLTGLTPNTQYSVYYRANCGNGDVSPWSVASNFTTQCAPITLSTINDAIACDSYSLVQITEASPSNNAGLTLGYYTGPNGSGSQITANSLTSSQSIYAYASAGSCSTQQLVNITINYTPQLTVLNPTICLGTSTVLWATQGTAIDFIYTQNGSTIGNGLNYQVSPSTTSSYGISAVGFGGCTSAEQQSTVTVNQPTTSTTSITSCSSYLWNGQTYTQSGAYTFTTTNASGCDSVATLNLTITNPSAGSETLTACDSLVWNGQTYTFSGTYTYLTTNSVGCDSTVTLNLTINYSSSSSTDVIACVSYQWNGQTYTQSGTYTYNFINASGCPSTATLNLTINNALFTTENVSACVSYDWNGQTYTQSGTYTFLATSVTGCDSTATLNLTINQPSSSTTSQTACDSYDWNGQTYTQSGTYVFNTLTVNGCDSTATLVLTINNSSTSSTTQSACNSYTWNGQTYTQSGTYTYTTTNAVGCDSTATLVLTVNNSTTSSTTQEACGTYTWNGQTYTQSGTYTYNTTNTAGCDSTATLILTINAIPTATVTDNGDGTGTASTGSTYQWIDCATNSAITGATQQTFSPTETGEYSVVVTNASGCSDTSTCVTINVANIKELNTFSVEVKPNPSNGLFNLTMNTTVNGSITITDATGRIIGTQTINGISSVIDLTNSVTGIYYLTVQINEFEKVIRVIKN